MKRTCLIATFLLTAAIMFGLVGVTESALITLDNVRPNLLLLSPNGGEELYFGHSYNILWQLNDTNLNPNSIQIYYLPGDLPQVPIALWTSNDGIESWIPPSETCMNARILIQASDSFGNGSVVQSAAPFQVIASPPAPPQGVSMQIVNTWDALITWQPVTQTVTGEPVSPDGYLVLYNERADQSPENYYFLAETTECSHLHQRIARWRDLYFYRVVAYVDPDARIGHNLDALQDAKQSFTLGELRKALSETPGAAK